MKKQIPLNLEPVKMTNELAEASIDDIAKLLAPLIDIFTCDRTSLTNLRRNHEKIISKLNQTGRPVLLAVDGQALLLCDAKLYLELETRRQQVLSPFKSIEDAIKIGRVDLEDPRIVELREVQERIASLETEIKERSWTVMEAEKELADAHARAVALTAALRRWRKPRR